MNNKYLHKLVSLIQDRQFQLYTVIGLSGVAIDFIIFATIVQFTDINYLVANFISITIAIINNFILNAYFNFKKTDGLLYRFASFYFVGLLGIILSQILLTVFVSVGFTEIIAKILTLPPILLFQFVLNKKLSFSEIDLRNNIAAKNIINYIRHNNKNLAYFAIILIITLIGFFVSSKEIYFSDEFDNILGASLILDGKMPYLDYFSHHAPLPYFLGTLFYSISHDNLILFRQLYYVFIVSWWVINALLILRIYGRSISILFYTLAILLLFPLFGNAFMAESLILPALLTLLIIVLGHKASIKNIFKIYFLFSFITIWIGLNNPLYLPAELMIIAYYSIVSRSTILKNKILFKLTLVYVVPLILVGVLFLMSPLYNQFSQDYINFNRNYYSEFNPNVLSIFGLKILVIDGVKEIITQFSSLNSVFSINGFFLLGWLGAFLYAFVYRNILLNLLLLGLWFSTQLRSVALSIDGEVSNHHTLIWRGLAVYFACALLITATISLLNKYKLISIHKIFIYGVCSLIFLSFLSTIGYALNDNKNLIIGPVNNRQANDDAKLYRKIITNSTNKYSFAGPLKFHYYIGLLGENPSRYYFYLPWHSVCTECTSELNLSFTKNNPSVIYWDDTGTIWSYPTTSWDKTIKEYLANNKYIQSRNNKLQNYYFYSEIDKIKAETLVNGYK